jgi:cobyrinic acid a,c-diamide synthase
MTGFLIAGTSSGVGKTTVTLAIIAALRRRGLIVQPFKGGPDFLDTGHHTRISGRVSRNLDTWMLSHESNRDVLRRASQGADVLIAEGMMGLFDGKSGADETGSSAEIAKLLKLPVVLVVDAGKSARSIAAVVLGFETFDPELPLAGMILNRVAGERHFKMLEAAIIARCSTPILGWLPREPSVSIPERHLGLHTAEEQPASELAQQIDALAKLAEEHLALDRLLALQCGLDLTAEPAAPSMAKPRVRIGVARDAAFTFYYEDNLDLLREEGAEIVPFSPLHDLMLPAGLDALYLGGGYPELHVEALSSNTSMLDGIRTFAASQRPIYAECGGMMYLADSLTTKEGQVFSMAGVLPLQVEMTARLVRFGYVAAEFTRDCLLGPAGTKIRGHSFHYSNISGTKNLFTNYQVDYSLSGRQEAEGFGTSAGNILSSYIHLHFLANPIVAKHFIGRSRGNS